MNLTFWLSFLLVLLGNGGYCDRVQFYGKENYEGFLKQFDVSGVPTNKCHRLDDPLIVKSLKTDRCIMLYGGQACNQDFIPKVVNFYYKDRTRDITYSIRVDSDTTEISQPLDQDGTQTVQSFSVCSRELGGGPEVDVDFYGFIKYKGPNIFKPKTPASEFRNTCGCQNLEKDWVGGKSKQISVDNWGNSIELFEGEHCTGQMRTLRAGVSPASRELWPGNDGMPVFDVQSFRPTNYQDCIILDASITKFVFENGTQEMIKNTTEQNVKLATDAILRNNGAQSIEQDYEVSGRITEKIDITTSEGYSNMHSVKASVKTETEVKAGLKFLAEGKVKVEVALGYEYQRSDSGQKTNSSSVVKEEAVTVSQKIVIGPCRECTASSFVKKMKNFPIKYTAYSRVNGTAGGNKMSAREVRSALRPEVKYLGDADEYAVNTMVEGVMYAEYGINSFINVDCKPISGCMANPPGAKNVNAEPLNRKFVLPFHKSAI